MCKTILFVGGGTLGHISPAVPVIKELKKRNPNYKIYFISTNKKTEKDYIKKNMGKYLNGFFYFDVMGFKRKVYKLESIKYNLLSLKKYIRNKKGIKKKLNEIKPDLVIGMGGYISAMLIKKVKKENTKIIIHEQNAFMGLANKMIRKKADKILTAFPIKEKKEKYRKKEKLVYNPSINETLLYKNKGFEKENTVLVISGSMGSSLINNLAIDTALVLKNYKFTIVCGKKYYNDNINKINCLKNDINLIPFSNDLLKLIKENSIIVSRAGSSTLFEILGLEKASILIPSSFVSDNHQYYNAKYLEEKKQALLLLEEDASVNKLKELIVSLNESFKLKNNIIVNIKKDEYLSSLNKFIFEIEDIL